MGGAGGRGFEPGELDIHSLVCHAAAPSPQALAPGALHPCLGCHLGALAWPTSSSPSPTRGFNSSLVPLPAGHTGEIAGGVAGSILLLLLIAGLVVYRNWRYEQELDSLLWKVDWKDIKMAEAPGSTNGVANGATANGHIPQNGLARDKPADLPDGRQVRNT